MLKEKSLRLFRRIKRNIRPLLLLWFPAFVIVAFFASVLFSVLLSKDNSFHSCGIELTQCIGEQKKLWPVAKCAYRAAWCDINVVWDKMRGKPVLIVDLPGLPPVDEKADKELFEKLTTDEFLDQRFEEFQAQELAHPPQTGLPPQEKLKEYMQEIRAERIRFEKEQAKKREKLAAEITKEESDKDKLTGQKAK